MPLCVCLLLLILLKTQTIQHTRHLAMLIPHGHRLTPSPTHTPQVRINNVYNVFSPRLSAARPLNVPLHDTRNKLVPRDGNTLLSGTVYVGTAHDPPNPINDGASLDTAMIRQHSVIHTEYLTK